MPFNSRDLLRLASESSLATIQQQQLELEAMLKSVIDSGTQLAALQAELTEALAPMPNLHGEILAELEGVSDVHRHIDRLSGSSLAALTALEQVIALDIPDITGIDEAFALLSRLSTPDVEAFITSQLELHDDAPVAEQALLTPADREGVESSALGDVDTLPARQTTLSHAVIERIGLVGESDRAIIDLMIYVALATGSWAIAVVFAIDVLRQRILATHPTTLTITETDRDWIVRLEWDSEGEGWVTFVPELNNISTGADTREEAIQRTHEAIRGYLKAAAKRGFTIPAAPSHRAGSRKTLRIQSSPA